MSKSARDSNTPVANDEVVLLWFHVHPVSHVHSIIEELHIQIWKLRLVYGCCEPLCVVLNSPLGRNLCRLIQFSLSLHRFHLDRDRFRR